MLFVLLIFVGIVIDDEMGVDETIVDDLVVDVTIFVGTVVGDKDVNDGAVVVDNTVVVLASMKNTSCY